ncbi:Galactose oxidase-like Early set domain-containing protein [Abortiporus biennis]
MTASRLSTLVFGLAATVPAVLAQTHKAGTWEDGGNTQVSAMMLFVGNEEKVYVLDKSEANAAKFGNFPAMGAVYDIAGRDASTMGVTTNVFCASGMHLPNGSYVTFGGNGAIGPGGNVGDVPNPGGGSGQYDSSFGDYDGTTAIRILNPCTGDPSTWGAECQWFDNASLLSMQKHRWYSAAEPLGDGSIAIIGGFTNGGYINRNYPNLDPAYEGGAAEPTYEFFPSKGEAQVMQFMIKTSGLNAYALSYLLPSGNMLVQANYSTIIWEPLTNVEHDLPDMPGNIVRVYPASGANAMLPLTPANNYTPTVIFCGGSDMPDSAWGNYSWPFIDTWLYPASAKCHSITPEPLDGSTPAYVEDDDMPAGRTMGQFIALPDGTMLVVNGGLNGTAGYSTQTLLTTSYADMPYGMSLASGPVLTPAIYNPKAPKGQRWSTAGLDDSKLPRLYHSSAVLLPDASVLIAGSNPNVDVNTTTFFPTTYQAEIFYPPYFNSTVRPVPTGIPKTLSYGGDAFDLTVPASSYTGNANDAADSALVYIIRSGFTTHAMNMGQRSMQLNNTYTVNKDGSLTLHVAQPPPNPNLFQPGPAFMYVTINGIPSNGTMLIVGNGQIGTQPTAAASTLPNSVRLDGVSGSGVNNGSGSSSGSSGSNQASGASHTGPIIGGIIGAIALVGILGAVFGICLARRRRAASQQAPSTSYPMGAASSLSGVGGAMASRGIRNSDSSAFVPLQQDNHSVAWGTANASSLSINSPYRDDTRANPSGEFDPYYQNAPRQSSTHVRY